MEEGDDSSLPYALSHLPLLELRAGNWAQARAVAEELLELAEATGQEFQRGQALYLRGNVAAHQGDLHLAQASLDESLVIARGSGDDWSERAASTSLGFLALVSGNPPAARDRLELSDAIRRRVGIGDVGQRREGVLLIEALVELNDLDPARALADEIDHEARVMDRPAWRARAARASACARAAEGDLQGAADGIAEAITQHERVMFPFDLGQTLLLKGQVERRQRKKATARESFTQALGIFEQLGARPWIERAHHTEWRVAELAGSGLTNRELASALFVSTKIVEANLARVYRTLRIRSRAELGRAMAASGDAPDQSA